MDVSLFLNRGISNISSTVTAFYLKNLKGISFLRKFIPELKKSAEKREQYEKNGIHIPPFLIASIASQCNLRCKGCYARAEGMCSDEKAVDELSASRWAEIFDEASQIGVSFILLAGGEPLLKREIIENAAKHKNIAFPVFTNGTLLDNDYIKLFNDNRNLIPVFSIEGEVENTDLRRGKGISSCIEAAMAELAKQKVLFAVSVTVTTENIDLVTSDDFVKNLRNKGCGVVFYIEYVPITADTQYLTLDEDGCEVLLKRATHLKKLIGDLTVLCFPGDEKYMGGCLAAGRGFFHISPTGAAEPCPFSPYSKITLKDLSLIDAIKSPFFGEVRKISAAAAEHKGGCTLFLHKDEVRELQK